MYKSIAHALFVCLLTAGVCRAQDSLAAPGAGDATASARKADAASSSDTPLTIFPHSDRTPWYVAGQANIIFQAHPAFHSPYDGPNSLNNAGEYKTSLVGTMYLGYQPWRGLHGRDTNFTRRYNTDVILDFESAGGRGLSQALGLASFTNLDVVRNPNLGSKPYIARVQIHQTIGLSNEMVEATRGPLALATEVPVRRLEFRIGKMSMPDTFDINSVLSDSHLQFTGWAIDNNGAWDYAADTRGYTYGAVLEYQDRSFAVRYGLALMPTVANGITLDWAISRARGQNMEFELRRSVLKGRKGTYRVLSFVNNAHMGSYREAVNAYLSGQDAKPDVSEHAKFDALKYGFGFNFEQGVTDHLTVAGRFGWNDGHNESYAYTEIDQTVLVGGSYDGAQWGRPNDKVGVAFVSDAIKRDHQNYLRYGGLGFILGDGNLNYGRENSLESYYNMHTWRGLNFALGLTHVNNPGYNRDRGPVWVPSVRAHVDF